MINTVARTRCKRRLRVTETMQLTALSISDGKGAFHHRDVLFALDSQGVRVTELQVYQGLRRSAHTRLPHLFYRGRGWWVWKSAPPATPAPSRLDYDWEINVSEDGNDYRLVQHLEDGTSELLASAEVSYNDYHGWFMLDEIKVKPGYRRHGLATELMWKIVDDYNHSKLFLVVEPFSDQPMSERELKKFYRKFGFKRCGPSTMLRPSKLCRKFE